MHTSLWHWTIIYFSVATTRGTLRGYLLSLPLSLHLSGLVHGWFALERHYLPLPWRSRRAEELPPFLLTTLSPYRAACHGAVARASHFGARRYLAALYSGMTAAPLTAALLALQRL